jgi:hypothetical protein
MRHYPDDDDDMKETARLEAPVWMLEQLKLNPSYVHWGPSEDYMSREGDRWDSRVICESWETCGFELDEYNEVVNFYFQIGRPTRDCETCAGKGSHPDAQWITESWYRHSSPFTVPDLGENQSKAIMERFGCKFTDGINGRGALPPDEVINRYGNPFLEHCVTTIENGGEWSTNLTQDEVDALWEGGRLTIEFKEQPTAEGVNRWAKSRVGLGHDAINSWICCKRRCERLGVPQSCPTCEGHGHLFTGPAYLSLVLWVLHPRKGCSRGVEVNHIQESELPEVYAYLREAAERNAGRFGKITHPVVA